MKISLIAIASAAAALCACPPGATNPTTDPDAGVVETGPGGTMNGLCSLLEGLDDSGAVRTICATADEIASLVSFITMLRSDRDAGPPAALSCTNLPKTTFCATKQEVAKGVLFLTRARAARLSLDGGAAR
jgi:hypothetical protein